jgi:hypothetical protein
MRKYSLLLIPLFIWGCEKTYDNIIDVSQDSYQVTVVAHKDSLDLKNPADSIINIRVIFSPESEVLNVSFDIFASDNSKLNSSPVKLEEEGQNLFKTDFELKEEYPNGNYNINFTVTGTGGNSKMAAVSSFHFNNGQDNFPPVIANTVIEPDTVVVDTMTVVIFTSVEASDPNGKADIEEVYFIVYRPDSTTSGNKTFLFDDGNLENGDAIAGDGIYSRLIEVNETNAKGTYRFEFQAEDRLGELSNIINHLVLIQ